MKGYFLDDLICMKKQTFGFQRQPLVYMCDGRLAALFLYHIAQVARRDMQLGRIVGHFVQLPIGLLDLCKVFF